MPPRKRKAKKGARAGAKRPKAKPQSKAKQPAGDETPPVPAYLTDDGIPLRRAAQWALIDAANLGRPGFSRVESSTAFLDAAGALFTRLAASPKEGDRQIAAELIQTLHRTEARLRRAQLEYAASAMQETAKYEVSMAEIELERERLRAQYAQLGLADPFKVLEQQLPRADTEGSAET